MSRIYRILGDLFLIAAMLAVVSINSADAQQRRGGDNDRNNRSGGVNRGSETFTGTLISYGSGFNTRTVTTTFTLRLNGQTSDEEASRYLSVLQEEGQDDVLRQIRNNDLGFFSVGANVGRRLNVVRDTMENGRRKLFIVFERWTQFAEVRGGYRSLDYPFGVIELSLDERTGSGEGTYIAAARLRWTRRNQVEVENFATFPGKLMGVRRSGR